LKLIALTCHFSFLYLSILASKCDILKLFSKVAVSPGGIYYRPAHLKGSFSTITFPPGATLLPPLAEKRRFFSTDLCCLF